MKPSSAPDQRTNLSQVKLSDSMRSALLTLWVAQRKEQLVWIRGDSRIQGPSPLRPVTATALQLRGLIEITGTGLSRHARLSEQGQLVAEELRASRITELSTPGSQLSPPRRGHLSVVR